jgi:hypothetical protein
VTTSRRKRWAGHVARVGDRIDAYRVLVERSEEKIAFGIPSYRWEDIINL